MEYCCKRINEEDADDFTLEVNKTGGFDYVASDPWYFISNIEYCPYCGKKLK